jgi:hypothetical protein
VHFRGEVSAAPESVREQGSLSALNRKRMTSTNSICYAKQLALEWAWKKPGKTQQIFMRGATDEFDADRAHVSIPLHR